MKGFVKLPNSASTISGSGVSDGGEYRSPSYRSVASHVSSRAHCKVLTPGTQKWLRERPRNCTRMLTWNRGFVLFWRMWGRAVSARASPVRGHTGEGPGKGVQFSREPGRCDLRTQDLEAGNILGPRNRVLRTSGPRGLCQTQAARALSLGPEGPAVTSGAQSGLRFLLCMKRGHDCSAGCAFCGSLHVQWGQGLVWEPAVKMGPASLGPEKSGIRAAPAPPVSLLLRVRLWRPWQAGLRKVSLPSPQRSPRPCGRHRPWVRTLGMYGVARRVPSQAPQRLCFSSPFPENWNRPVVRSPWTCFIRDQSVGLLCPLASPDPAARPPLFVASGQAWLSVPRVESHAHAV